MLVHRVYQHSVGEVAIPETAERTVRGIISMVSFEVSASCVEIPDLEPDRL